MPKLYVNKVINLININNINNINKEEMTNGKTNSRT